MWYSHVSFSEEYLIHKTNNQKFEQEIYLNIYNKYIKKYKYIRNISRNINTIYLLDGYNQENPTTLK